MKNTLLLLFCISSLYVFAQDVKTSKFTKKIKEYNISELLTLEKITLNSETPSFNRSEPLGYIGKDYQRFHIHLISAYQDPDNKLKYHVQGKTRVKNIICDFQGEITIIKSKTYNEGDYPDFKQGFVTGKYEFSETPGKVRSGMLKGVFRTDFHINVQDKINYNALMFQADGFKNNQFEGTHTNHKSKIKSICNWGDYRIPNSDALNIGAAEFLPADKFLENGWESYKKDMGYSAGKIEMMEATIIEGETWWVK